MATPAAQTAAVVHAAGEPYNEHAPPTFWYFNNWQGNGWRWFLKYGIVEAFGSPPWLPGGANEDAELRQLQEARQHITSPPELEQNLVAFKKQCNGLAEEHGPSNYKTPSTITQLGYMFYTMKKGDIVVMTSNGKYGQDKGE